MGVTAITSDAEPAAAVAFTAAVRDALPATGFWTMPVLAAVSGGGDSMALVLALRRLVPADAVRRLVVVHAEHDLRDEAGDDRLFVERLAARLGLACESRRLPVRPARGEGIEAAARRLRYEFMIETAAATGARHVVVAHTADDQAETILHRLLRGTGLAGLAGMSRARELSPGVSLLRPLLGMRRTAPRAFLTAIGEPWREDATNTDVRHARNFVRHELLAPCEQGAYPACIESIVRLGGQAAVHAAALASAAERLLDDHGRREREGTIVLDASRLAGLDPHLLAEVFVALWRREAWPRRDMTAEHYAALARFVAVDDATAVLPGAVHVEADGRTVRLQRRA
jgi:tRNA(Ile)-lysidine synthase